MHKVEWTKDALEDLEKLDNPVIKRILNKLTWFSNNFEHITPESLSGELASTYKIRIGDWRVIYTLEENLIVIQAVGHRRDIYK